MAWPQWVSYAICVIRGSPSELLQPKVAHKLRMCAGCVRPAGRTLRVTVCHARCHALGFEGVGLASGAKSRGIAVSRDAESIGETL